MSEHIPMLDLKLQYQHMRDEIDTAIKHCLEHQRWILGPEVQELEKKAAAYLEAGNCIGASSGTEALVLALRGLAISRTGRQYFDSTQQILTTAFTFTATGDAILRSGATPIFVDIDPLTFNMDLDLAAGYLEKNKSRVVGILPVHLYGRPCPMDAILELAGQHGLFVVEDVAQAFGGTWQGRKLGSLGDAGAFSFFPSKNLGGFGDGGMVAARSEDLAEVVRMLIKHGGKDKYNVDHVGYNARLDTLQAAVVLARMKHVDDFNRRRQYIAARYSQGLAGVQDIKIPGMDEPGHVWHQYTLRVEDGRRDALQVHLKEKNVASMVYYPHPLHRMRVFENRFLTTGDMTHTEEACASVLNLPIEPLMDEDTITRVIEAVRSFSLPA